MKKWILCAAMVVALGGISLQCRWNLLYCRLRVPNRCPVGSPVGAWVRDQEGAGPIKLGQHLLQTDPHNPPWGALRRVEAYDILDLRKKLVTQFVARGIERGTAFSGLRACKCPSMGFIVIPDEWASIISFPFSHLNFSDKLQAQTSSWV